jgi:hypothetical protein
MIFDKLRMEERATNLPLATGEGNVHEAAGVCDSLLRPALGGLLLLLRLNLLISIHQHSFLMPINDSFGCSIPSQQMS